jgi:type I restriction enzyme S subunit
MEEWKKIKACNYCYNVTDGTHDSPKQKESGRYLITSKHIKNNRIDFESAYKISEDDYNKIISRSKVDQWDIIISMIGAYCGFCCIESSNCTEYAIKNVGLLKVGDELKSRWLYYYLTSPKGKQQLSILRSGSSQPYISLGALRDLEIPVPRERVMNGIVSFLKSLDDKIELNRRINDNLEQQAQALFKSWFVDFEPFKDGKFVDSELGMIPEGWKVGTFSDIILSTIGGDWGKDSLLGNYSKEVFCIRGADIPEIRKGNKGKMPTRFILEKNYLSKALEPDNIVVEISGGSPTQSTGRICIISDELKQKYNNSLICTNFCRAIKPYNGYASYIYYLWDMLYNKGVMFLYENGTTGIKNFDINGFIEKEQIIIPTKEVTERFAHTIELLSKQIQQKGTETESLVNIRDSLLPKLMSGELKIKDLNN